MDFIETSKSIKIVKFSNSSFEQVEDKIIIEFPLTIYISGEQYGTLLCTPEYEKELILGYLYSENVIKSMQDIRSMSIDLKSGEAFIELKDKLMLESDINKKRLITSGCASNTVFYNAIDKIKLTGSNNREKVNLDIEAILETMMHMNKSSKLFLETGGVHIALLSDLNDFNISREDIGRHNAIDKIVGHIILNEIEVDDKILFSSGRLSSEMLLKSAKIGIKVIVSKSAPMDMAIRIADQLGLILIGFARGKRCNIYSGFDLLDSSLI